MLSAFRSALTTPDLRKKILFTLGMVAVYRLGAAHPVARRVLPERPGVHRAGRGRRERERLLADQPVLRRRAAAAVGLRAGHHALHHGEHHRPAADGGHPAVRAAEEGRAVGSEQADPVHPLPHDRAGRSCSPPASSRSPTAASCSATAPSRSSPTPASSRSRSSCSSMTAGTAVIMWLGEQITERGIGNGMSLLIFTVIAARIPAEGAQHPRPTPAAWSSPASACSAWRSSRASCSSSRASGASPSSTPSAWSGGGCTAARRPTCRSRSTRPASSR